MCVGIASRAGGRLLWKSGEGAREDYARDPALSTYGAAIWVAARSRATCGWYVSCRERDFDRGREDYDLIRLREVSRGESTRASCNWGDMCSV